MAYGTSDTHKQLKNDIPKSLVGLYTSINQYLLDTFTALVYGVVQQSRGVGKPCLCGTCLPIGNMATLRDMAGDHRYSRGGIRGFIQIHPCGNKLTVLHIATPWYESRQNSVFLRPTWNFTRIVLESPIGRKKMHLLCLCRTRITLGSAIFISPLKSIICNGPQLIFQKSGLMISIG